MNLTFLKKIKNTDLLMGAKFNLRHIYFIHFLIFVPFFALLTSKFEKSTTLIFLIKKVSKTQNFMLI
jgi:hypothetical protein